MTPKFIFSAHAMRHAISLVRLVKPSSGDFTVRFDSRGMSICSFDKRRVVLANVVASDVSDDIDDTWRSNEYPIAQSKISLFDAKLDSVSFSPTENSMAICAVSGKQTKKATVKRRVDSTRRSSMPSISWGDPVLVDADKFARLLRQVGCSALPKETKTDEEMRVNQVHFHADSCSASSNARYHASIASIDDMKLDVSIVGSDIPIIRSFCSKLEGSVGLFHDKHRLCVIDVETKSAMAIGKVASAVQDFSVPTDEFTIEVSLEKEELVGGLDWALTALDGTQRLSCEISDGTMRMSNNGEIFSMPVSLEKGSPFSADIPAKFLKLIADHLDSDKLRIKFGHPSYPTLLEISGYGDSDVRVQHYMFTMRKR